MITLLSVGYGDIYPVTPVGQFLTMIITVMGLGLVALPTGILASGFTAKMNQQNEDFQKMVDQKVSDGALTPTEKIELDIEASTMGLSKTREKRLEADELSAVQREQQEDFILKAGLAQQSVAGLSEAEASAQMKAELAEQRSMSVGEFEAFLARVDRLSLSEKSRLVARVAQDMAQRIDGAPGKSG